MSDEKGGATVPDTDSVFTNHFVLYLDFLGVSEAASVWEEARAARLIAVLEMIAAARASFTMDGKSLPDDSYKFKITAETSTFSDHIVASYPVFDDAPMPIDLVMDMYLKLSQDMVGTIAVEALKIGLLVRGGLTIGKLHHSDGVVFGEAMGDAHRLERRVAIFPRVAVSSRIYANLLPDKRDRLLHDSDGIWRLDYFSNMVTNIAPTEREQWIGTCAELIDCNVDVFEKAERWNEFAKWSWFKGLFSALVR